MADVLRRRVLEALGPEASDTWRWVPRRNRAADHPTDFALIELLTGADSSGVQEGDKGDGASAVAAAEAERALTTRLVGAFRGLHPDRRFSGRLRSISGGKEAPAAAEAAGATGRRDDVLSVSKPPGRLTTRPTIGLDTFNSSSHETPGSSSSSSSPGSRLQESEGLKAAASTQRALKQSWGFASGDDRVTTLLGAGALWESGHTGAGIKVGIFDTGIRIDHPAVRNIVDRSDWTTQGSLEDGLGHGSFVAGVVASTDAECPGFAPDAEIYTFKVFTDDQVSYTSWFLDAFNYAMEVGVHIINLSIGGPDYLDAPFVDKVKEVTASGILMVSAIGNDGPLYGTLNNPADESDVIGVGGIDNDGALASFSSRGMTTHELPAGVGRIKPDVMAYAKDVSGSGITGGCRRLSGTSVASPVVTGCVALLASTVPAARRWDVLNPASMKQALIEGADRLPGMNVYEQGSGRVNLGRSQEILASYEPRASLVPSLLDFTECPYMWPYCRQPLYAFGLPLAFNATVLNGMGPSGRFVGSPMFEASDEGGRLLAVTFTHSDMLWPWSGFLGIFIEVSPAAWGYTGVATGVVTFTIESPAPWGSDAPPRRSTVRVPLRVGIVPTPPRSKRVLWDVLHSVRYPPGYVPRDNLDIKSDILDWHGDHPYTNYHGAFDALLDAGYSVEVLHSPLTCVDLRNYGSLLVIDSEDEWYPEEVAAVEAAVKESGLALLVFAEWYHSESLAVMRFYDDNTRSWWTPITGGANVPALNDLLAPHGIALGDAIVHGTAAYGRLQITVSYGTSIHRFPAGGALFSAVLADVAARPTEDGGAAAGDTGTRTQHAVLGLTRSGRGAVAVFGDSNCLDSSHQVAACYDLLLAMLDQAVGGVNRGLSPRSYILSQDYIAPHFTAPPARRTSVNFTEFSYTLSHPLTCGAPAPCTGRGSRGLFAAAGAGTLGAACPEGAAWQHTWLEPGKEPAWEVPEAGQQPKQAAVTAAAAAAAAAAAIRNGGSSGRAVRLPARKTVHQRREPSALAAEGPQVDGAGAVRLIVEPQQQAQQQENSAQEQAKSQQQAKEVEKMRRRQEREKQRQAELRQQQEEALRRAKLTRRKEEKRRAQEEKRRQEEVRLQQDKLRQEEQKRRQEEVRRQEVVRLQQEEKRRQQETRRRADLARQQAEKARLQEEKRRQEEVRLQEEKRRQEETRRQEEKQRQQEEEEGETTKEVQPPQQQQQEPQQQSTSKSSSSPDRPFTGRRDTASTRTALLSQATAVTAFLCVSGMVAVAVMLRLRSGGSGGGSWPGSRSARCGGPDYTALRRPTTGSRGALADAA